MIRILQVIGEMNCGGAEMILMNLYRNIDRTVIQFDFVVHTENKCMYDEEIMQLGGTIYHCPKFMGKNYFSYKKWWERFFDRYTEYKIIHGHIGSSATIYLNVAHQRGLFTIAHSHATTDTERSLKSVVWSFFSYPTRFVADYFMACSKEAGIDRYGKKVVSSNNFSVMNNAINCEQFRFDRYKRELFREKLGVASNFVIGHVGRFSPPKNHHFIIEVFESLIKKDSNARLLLLGDGPLRNEIEELCREKNISEKVIFAGIQRNTEDYYMAMDCFLFPSNFEGLGIVAVEAQTSGLPVIASDVVPKLADLNAGLFEQLSLNASHDIWADAILKNKKATRNGDHIDSAIKAGYEIKTVAAKLQEFYLNNI